MGVQHVMDTRSKVSDLDESAFPKVIWQTSVMYKVFICKFVA